jgi:hypothetical protein
VASSISFVTAASSQSGPNSDVRRARDVQRTNIRVVYNKNSRRGNFASRRVKFKAGRFPRETPAKPAISFPCFPYFSGNDVRDRHKQLSRFGVALCDATSDIEAEAEEVREKSRPSASMASLGNGMSPTSSASSRRRTHASFRVLPSESHG